MATIFNTPIYNLISVPQITSFLLEEAVMSSKTNRAVAARSRRELVAKLEIMKTMSATFSFISIPYLRQQTNIFRCFSSLKFENSLFSSKFFKCIFRNEKKVFTT